MDEALCYKKVAGSNPMKPYIFFHLPNTSSRTMILGFTQIFPGVKARPGRKADNLTAMSETTV
jgi:hypothetical protein